MRNPACDQDLGTAVPKLAVELIGLRVNRVQVGGRTGGQTGPGKHHRDHHACVSFHIICLLVWLNSTNTKIAIRSGLPRILLKNPSGIGADRHPPHVQTADETIFPGGTGYLTAAGMRGPEVSVLGRSIGSVIWRHKTGMLTRFPVAKGPVRLCGVIVGIAAAHLSGQSALRR